MRRVLRPCLLLLLALSLLTLPALADFGPKPQLTVRVKNAPEELYYLDILAEGSPVSTSGADMGLKWNYSYEELLALDQSLLDALRAAVPEGWHACLTQSGHQPPIWGQLTGEAKGSAMVHTFGYSGVPARYRLLLVTASGEVWLSDVTERQVLQSSVTLDWAEKTLTVPPVWMAFVLQFLATLLPTLLIEGLLLVLFGFSWRRNWKPFLLVNLLTQGGLTAATALLAVSSGVGFSYYLALLPLEAVILLAETAVYRRVLTGRSAAQATAYGVAANLCSALLGLLLAEPVWRFVVSIS